MVNMVELAGILGAVLIAGVCLCPLLLLYLFRRTPPNDIYTNGGGCGGSGPAFGFTPLGGLERKRPKVFGEKPFVDSFKAYGIVELQMKLIIKNGAYKVFKYSMIAFLSLPVRLSPK